MHQKAKITIEFTEEQLKIKEHYDRYLEDKINEYATKIALNSIENIKQMLRNDFIYDYIDCFEDENSLIAIY